MNAEAAGPGEQLRAAREALEVSTREVADALNLPIHVIEALEADDFDRLPPTVFTRGYLRSYARLLELVPEDVVASYPAPETDTEVMEQVVAEQPSIDPRFIRYGVAAGLVVLLIIAGIWFFTGDEPAVRPTAEVPAEPATAEPATAARPGAESAPTATGSTTAAVETTPATEQSPAPREVADQDAGIAVEQAPAETVSQDSATIAEPSAPAEPLAPVTAAPNTTAPAVSAPATADRGPAADVITARPAGSASTADGTGIRQITEFGDDLLEFSFIDECWVEVKTPDGDNLYSDLNRAGSTLKLRGQAPFRILLGYAPGVVLDFNGERVALSNYTRNNVATLVLGR